MENILPTPLPEIVFSSKESAVSRAIRRAVTTGKLRKIAPRIYTSNLADRSSDIVIRHQYHILSQLFPNAILSHRTALEGRQTDDGVIFLTYKYTKKITLPGLTIRLLKGPLPQDGDMPFMGNLFLSSRPRAFLENLQPSREKGNQSKTLSQKTIEDRLENMCQLHGVEALNRLRNQARQLFPQLEMAREFKKLDKMIGALAGTNYSLKLTSERAKARAAEAPYDHRRLELFSQLVAELKSHDLPNIFCQQYSKNLAFFESYFSNYIEGTEFEVEEAAKIIFENKIDITRPADSHDILGTFRVVSHLNNMQKTPLNETELITLLVKRHAILLEGRPDKNPGTFKEMTNRAGNTVFVFPALVKGTLKKGFELYKNLDNGLQKAIFIQFIISETHPFLDGNGRIARVMMNAELTSAKQMRIIIPTVYREDYLLALRKLSREGDAKPYIKTLINAQRFTSTIDFNDYGKAVRQLKRCHAFMEPYEGKLLL